MEEERRKRHFYRRWTAIVSWITGISVGSLVLIVGGILIAVAIFVRTETFQNSLRDRVLQVARTELGVSIKFEKAQIEIFSLEPKIHFEKVQIEQTEQKEAVQIQRISIGISVFSLPLLTFRQLVLSSAELDGLEYEITSTKIFDRWVKNVRPRGGVVPSAFKTSIQRLALSNVRFLVNLPQSERLMYPLSGEIDIRSIQVALSESEIEASGLSELRNMKYGKWGPYEGSLILDQAIQRGQNFSFRKLELSHGADKLNLSGTVQGVKNPILNVQGKVDFDIESFFPTGEILGHFKSDFHLSGPWNDLKGKGKSELAQGRWRVKKLDEASALWEISSKVVKLSELRWKDGGERGSGRLDLSLTDEKKIFADLVVENSDLGSYLPLLEDGLRNWKGLVGGRLKFEGQFAEKFIGTFKGDVKIDGFEIRSWGDNTEILKVPKVHVQTTGEIKSVTVGNLTANVDTEASQWSGGLEWSPEKFRLFWNSQFSGKYFGDLFQYPVVATGSLPGSYEGPWSHLVLRAQPQMKNFNLNGQDLTNLTGELKLEKRSLIGNPLRADQLDLQGGIKFVEEGPDLFDPIDFKIRGANFQRVLAFLNVRPEESLKANGNLFAQGKLTGRLLLPNGSGTVLLKGWSFNDAKQKGREVRAKWACSRGDFYLQDAELTAMSETDVIKAEATIDSNGFSHLTLQSPRSRLGDWAAVTDTKLLFQSFVDFSVNYQRDVPSLEGHFQLSETSFEGSIYQDSRFEVQWEKDQLRAEGNLLGESIRFQANANETPKERRAVIRAELKEANLAAFIPGIASTRLEVSSSGRAQIEWKQPLYRHRNLLTSLLFERVSPSGSIDVTEASLRRGASVYQQVKPFKIDIQAAAKSGRTRFQTSKIEVQSANRRLVMSGYYEDLSDFRMEIGGSTDLRSLAALVQVLSRSEGTLSVNGVWQPRGFSGNLEINEGLLTFEDSPLIIKDVAATLRATDSNFQVLRFSGNFREGSMSGSGIFRLREEGVVSANLGLKFDRILLQPLEGVSLRVSGPVDLRVDNAVGELKGKVFVTEGLFRRRIDLRSDLTNFFKEERRTFRPRDYEKAPWRQWTLAVGIQTADPFTVRNNLGEGTANFNLMARGTVGKPYLEGNVDIVRGQYSFNQKEFTIRSGSILFKNGQSNIPNYDIRSETEIAEYRLTTRLQGGPGQQKILYSSEPPLSEKDILSLIQFGLPASAEEFKGEDANRSISFSGLSFVTGGLQDKIESRLSKDLGIQRFQLTPSFFEETGRTELQLTLGTDLVKNRLAVNYSNYLSAAGGHRLELDFKVNRNVSLIGSWRDVRLEQGKSGESNDDFGGDIRFRFEIE